MKADEIVTSCFPFDCNKLIEKEFFNHESIDTPHYTPLFKSIELERKNLPILSNEAQIRQFNTLKVEHVSCYFTTLHGIS